MSDTLVVRRLPPLPLLSVAAFHPRATVVPFDPDCPPSLPTTAKADTRDALESLLAAGVQLVRVGGARPAGELTALLAGLPPERLVLELDRPAKAADILFAAGVSAGTVMVPSAVTDVTELKVLTRLPVERRVAVRVRPLPDLVEPAMRAIELFGVDRMLFWTDSTDDAELESLADAVQHIHKLFGLSNQRVDTTYGGETS